MKFLFFILILVLTFPIQMHGESSLLVVDSKLTPIAGATVTIINKQDSNIVEAKISNTNGQVAFEKSYTPGYKVIARCIGYEEYSADYNIAIDTIIMHESSTTLSEIVIAANPERLRRKSDRFVFTPGSLTKEVANSYDIIKLTPLIETNDGTFSIIGKGNSQVYINGRNPHMDSSALLEMLKALPSGQIKRVEIITSPGSSHSASASGGIINIVIDQPTQGYIGSLSTHAEYYNERVSPSVSSWNGYTHDKFHMAISASYLGRGIHDDATNTYDYIDLNKRVINSDNTTGWGNGVSGRINAQYNFSSRSILGIAVNLTASQSDITSKISSLTIDNALESYSNSVIRTESPWQRPNYGFQGYYTLVTDSKGSKLDITADYTNNTSTTNTSYDFADKKTLQYTKVLSSGIHLKTLYNYVFNPKHSLGVGYELFNSKIDNDYLAENINNLFRYKEMINSSYVEWNATWSNAFSTSAGIRVENSDISGQQNFSSENFSRNYTDFFPSLSLSLDLPGRGNQNISFDVTRYIYRPFYTLLNPFVYWTSETTCSKGNTNQRPEYAWEFSLFYSFLNDFVYGASYSSSSNALMDYTYQEGDVTVSSTRNFGKSLGFYTFLSYNHVFGGFWRVKADAQLSYSKFNAWLDNSNLSRHSVGFSFNIQNSIVASQRHRIRIGCNYAFYSPVKTVTDNGRYKNLFSVSFSKMFTNGLTLSLEASNLLGFKNDSDYTSAHYSYREHRAIYPVQVLFKLNYVFGKRQVSGAMDKYKSALDSRFK